MATAAETRKNFPRINYRSLEEICQLRKGKSHHDVDHAQFMKEYPRIFLTTKIRRPSEERWRSLSAQPKRMSHSPRVLKTGIHKLALKEQDEDSALTNTLEAMMAILQQHGPLRTSTDTKKLGALISQFPAIFGNTPVPQPVLDTIANRVIMERVTERGGMAFPREGGVYLILQGNVRELSRQEGSTCHYKTKILNPGDIFGEMKEPAYPQKHNYPVYMGYNRSAVMRVTLSDYTRAKQLVQEALHQRHLKLIVDSTVLSKFPQNIQNKLAKQIKWKRIRPFSKILKEGEPIQAVSIIKKGHCKAYMRVPDMAASVCVGKINERGCIGELYFDSPEAPSPYSIVSTTDMVLAYINTKDMDVDVRVGRAPSQKVYSINVPSKSELKELYAEKLSSDHWISVKKEVVNAVIQGRTHF